MGQATLTEQLKLMGTCIVLLPPQQIGCWSAVLLKTLAVCSLHGVEFRQVSDTGNVVTNIGGLTGEVRLGPTLSVANGILSANIPTQSAVSVTSVQGQTGAVNFLAGTGVNIAGTTISNTGVTSFGGASGALSVGRGLSVVGNTLASQPQHGSGSANIVITDNSSSNYTIADSGVVVLVTLYWSGISTNRCNHQPKLSQSTRRVLATFLNLLVNGSTTLG